MSAVSRATVHHEGDGIPRVVNLAYAGYSAGVFPESHALWRPPALSWGTMFFNHVSLDIVFTGNREVYAVTDDELRQLAKLCAEARADGWLLPGPLEAIHPHGTLEHAGAGVACLPGSSPTVCPGQHVYDRWSDIVAACQGTKWLDGSPSPIPPPPPVGVPAPLSFDEEDMPQLFVDETHKGIDANHPRVATLQSDGSIILGNGASVASSAPSGAKMPTVALGGLTVVVSEKPEQWKFGGGFAIRRVSGACVGFRYEAIDDKGQWHPYVYYFVA